MRGVNKRASIPVTIFTILVIVVFVFVLLSFFLMNLKSIGKINDPCVFISKFLLKKQSLIFTGENSQGISLEETEKTGFFSFIGLGKERLKFSIKVAE